MDRDHARDRYVTALVNNNQDGFSSLELFCTRDGTRSRVARVIFWDAAGQFYLESFGPETEIPLEIAEALIVEA